MGDQEFEYLEFPLLRDDVTKTIQRSILAVLDGKAYQHSMVGKWIEGLSDQCMVDLKKLGKSFKYIVSTTIFEKRAGAGFQSASSFYWNAITDGGCTVKWENQSIACVVVVFGLAL